MLLADEPTGNLDEATRDEIIALLEDLWQSRGLTLVLVTRDTAIASRAQRTAQLTAGRLAIQRAQDPQSHPQPTNTGRAADRSTERPLRRAVGGGRPDATSRP